MVRLLPLAPLLLLVGCDNPCQSMCVEMASYARECGYEVAADEVQTCREDFANKSLAEGEAARCVEASDPQQLREWWTCEELLENYQGAAN